RQQIRVAEFGREADSEHVEGPDGAMRIDGELRDLMLAHQGLQVRPDAVAALGEHARALVKHFVKNLDSLVGHAYLICVRVHQRPAHIGSVPVLDDAVEFAPDVLDRLAYQREQRLKPGVDRLNRHRYSLPTASARWPLATGREDRATGQGLLMYTTF